MGLSVICDNVREAISRPAELVMSPFHQFIQRALKSPVTIEQRGNSSFISLRRIFCAKDFEFFLTLTRWAVSAG